MTEHKIIQVDGEFYRVASFETRDIVSADNLKQQIEQKLLEIDLLRYEIDELENDLKVIEKIEKLEKKK